MQKDNHGPRLAEHGKSAPPGRAGPTERTVDMKAAISCAFGRVARMAREHSCWVHKTSNVFEKLPESIQPKAKTSGIAVRFVTPAVTRRPLTRIFSPRPPPAGLADPRRICFSLCSNLDENHVEFREPS
ncbi:MAG: hypothetical protein ACREDM_05215 [Methylocella sp.]